MSDPLEHKLIPRWVVGNSVVGTLQLGRPKLDGIDRRNWDAKILVKVESADSAPQLDMFHGDLSRHFIEAAEEYASFKCEVKPLKDQNVTVRISDSTGLVLEHVHIEVKNVKADFNTSRQIQMSTLVIRGLPVSDSNALIGLQGDSIRMEVVPSIEVVNPDIPQAGQLVGGVTTAGETVFGIMVGLDPETELIQLQDIGGTSLIQEVISIHTIECVDDSDVDTLVARLVEACPKPERLSWGGVVEAIGQAATAGEVQRMGATTAYINAQVFERALQLSLIAKAS